MGAYISGPSRPTHGAQWGRCESVWRSLRFLAPGFSFLRPGLICLGWRRDATWGFFGRFLASCWWRSWGGFRLHLSGWARADGVRPRVREPCPARTLNDTFWIVEHKTKFSPQSLYVAVGSTHRFGRQTLESLRQVRVRSGTVWFCGAGRREITTTCGRLTWDRHLRSPEIQASREHRTLDWHLCEGEDR